MAAVNACVRERRAKEAAGIVASDCQKLRL